MFIHNIDFLFFFPVFIGSAFPVSSTCMRLDSRVAPTQSFFVETISGYALSNIRLFYGKFLLFKNFSYLTFIPSNISDECVQYYYSCS